MSRRYVLAPEAALDLVQIGRYIKKNTGLEMADRVESVIRDKIVYLAGRPGGGHWLKDLTDEPVKFFSIYSYLTPPIGGLEQNRRSGPKRTPPKQCTIVPFCRMSAEESGFGRFEPKICNMRNPL
jgi:plasmid stabilization system protein ParE